MGDPYGSLIAALDSDELINTAVSSLVACEGITKGTGNRYVSVEQDEGYVRHVYLAPLRYSEDAWLLASKLGMTVEIRDGIVTAIIGDIVRTSCYTPYCEMNSAICLTITELAAIYALTR